MHFINSCATVANDGLRLALRVVTSVRDHTNNRKRTIVKTIALPIGDEEPVVISQEQAESVIASTVSRSGARIGILKESKEGDKIKRYVEIWRGSAAEAILDVTKEHGEFYSDGPLPLADIHRRPLIMTIRYFLIPLLFTFRKFTALHGRREPPRRRSQRPIQEIQIRADLWRTVRWSQTAHSISG